MLEGPGSSHLLRIGFRNRRASDPQRKGRLTSNVIEAMLVVQDPPPEDVPFALQITRGGCRLRGGTSSITLQAPSVSLLGLQCHDVAKPAQPIGHQAPCTRDVGRPALSAGGGAAEVLPDKLRTFAPSTVGFDIIVR